MDAATLSAPLGCYRKIDIEIEMETVWISVAFALGLIFHRFGLPPLVGYLCAGFALSAAGHQGGELLEQVAHAGVLLLLFSVGLKLRLKTLVRPEVWAGSVIHMLFFAGLLAVTVHFISGLDYVSSALIAIGLSFSSTVVAAKVLEQKKELRAFHGRAAIGILIVQDLLAVGLLSLLSGQTPSQWAVLLVLLPLIRKPLYKLLDFSGHDELLLLYGLALALVAGGAGFASMGLSSELGALVFGALLADHPRAKELADELWGLKEVFLVGFFLQIGMTGSPTLETAGYALLLLVLLPLKAALFFLILLRFKLRARSSFLTGLSLATYSEFGLIVISMGVEQNLLSAEWLVILAFTVALSFFLAAPLNKAAHVLYQRYERLLQRYERDEHHPDDEPIRLGSAQLLVVGMGRVGVGAYDFLTQRQQRVVGLDSDVAKVETHLRQGRRVLYADAEDPGLWQNINLDNIKAILLATNDFEGTRIAVTQLRRVGYQGFLSATSAYPEEVDAIIEAGADVAYNYFDEVGVGFAEHVWEALYPPP